MSSAAVPRAVSLATVQAWMQAVLVHPGGAEGALSTPEARRHLEPADAPRVVRERGALKAADRLQIYAGMYPLRMNETLRSDYPALAEFLGTRGFARLVSDYVAAHPSRSFTLACLGDRLPEFVANWGSPRRRGLLTDLARLERAAAEVFDAEETGPLDPSAMEDLPVDEWPSIKLVPAAAFRIVSVRPGAVNVLDAVLQGTSIPKKAGRGRIEVAYYRTDFVVRRRTLGSFAGRLVEQLAKGATLADGLSAASKAAPYGVPSVKELSGWFAEWTRLGFFAGIGRVEGFR